MVKWPLIKFLAKKERKNLFLAGSERRPGRGIKQELKRGKKSDLYIIRIRGEAEEDDSDLILTTLLPSNGHHCHCKKMQRNRNTTRSIISFISLSISPSLTFINLHKFLMYFTHLLRRS